MNPHALYSMFMMPRAPKWYSDYLYSYKPPSYLRQNQQIGGNGLNIFGGYGMNDFLSLATGNQNFGFNPSPAPNTFNGGGI